MTYGTRDPARLPPAFSQADIGKNVTVATDGVAEPTEANELLAGGFELVDGPRLEAVLVHTYASSSA